MLSSETITPSGKTAIWKSKRLWSIIIASLCVVTVGTLLFTGVIWPNNLFIGAYQVRGIDVSSYQHQIDWQRVAQIHLFSFAYIKATEGATIQDPPFATNWRGAEDVGLLRGAYHYFLVDQSGSEQASNFINTVPKEAGTLPPMLDIEVTGKDMAKTIHEIQIFLDTVAAYYGVQPLIYTDQERYMTYVKDHFADYPLFIRSVYMPVQWGAFGSWTFWQYNSRGHVDGISGYVDLDVFSGKHDQLKAFADHPA